MDALTGLTTAEAAQQHRSGQGNGAQFEASRTLLQSVRENLLTFFNVVLLGLGALLILFGEPIDAFFTTGIALTNILIAVTQEVWAGRKLDRIALLARTPVTVIRDGREQEIKQEEIVKDDLLVIGPGDQIVVDGTIVANGPIDVDESLLTGESQPVRKEAGDPVYSGSYCVSGRALYRATKVGAASFANALAARARAFTREHTPLQREIEVVIRVLLVVVVTFALLLAISDFLHGRALVESVRNASVLFGLAPSSLFLMIVVAYAIGAVRMADKGALVQRINSVESLCHVTLICFDKTGTLTTNRLGVDSLVSLQSPEQLPVQDLGKLLGDFGRSAEAGNRTNEALSDAFPGERRLLVEEVPFSSARQWSAMSFEDDKQGGTYYLGAPEVLCPRLSAADEIDRHVQAQTARGLRVLLFACLPRRARLHDSAGSPTLPDELIPLCLVALEDELRPEARQTLANFASAGVSQKIISGDHPQTVAAVASQAGFDRWVESETIVSGPQLAAMDEAEFAEAARKASIFGRITPEQKERLIRTFRQEGEYVAMTGDGVNDVLALKQAHLGIAMQSGSRATRNAADIVLLDDSFAALPLTLIEGQRILQGMQDILRLYFTRILYLALLVAAISIIGIGFPFTPPQNAFISTWTLTIPAFLLGLWARPGPVPEGGLVPKLLHFVIPAVIVTAAAGLGVYLFYLASSRSTTGQIDVGTAQQALTYAMVTCGILLVVFVEPPSRFWAGGDVLGGDSRPARVAVALFFAVVTFLSFPWLRNVYDLDVLKPTEYALIAAVVVAWATVLRFAWRAHLLERYLHVSFD